jgi:hypothetical protein
MRFVVISRSNILTRQAISRQDAAFTKRPQHMRIA